MADMGRKPDESPTPKQQKSLLQQLVAMPTSSPMVLVILITAVISAIILVWIGFSWQHGEGAPP